MKLSIEISLYPLANQQYEDVIWQFIEQLHSHACLKVETNGMSTQVFGEYDDVVKYVMDEVKRVHQTIDHSVFVLKLVPSDRSDFVSKF